MSAITTDAGHYCSTARAMTPLYDGVCDWCGLTDVTPTATWNADTATWDDIRPAVTADRRQWFDVSGSCTDCDHAACADCAADGAHHCACEYRDGVRIA